jgi:hypothetical protein
MIECTMREIAGVLDKQERRQMNKRKPLTVVQE